MTRTSAVRNLFLLPVFLLSACTSSSQQTAQPATLDAFVQQTSTALPERLQRFRVLGAAVALVQDGEVAWVRGFGLADEDTGMPVTSETIFQVASISKSVTAWGVMRLADRGRIDPDAPVAQYLSTWQLPPSEFDQEGVTVRRLLSHTAGIAPWHYAGTPIDQTPPTLVELLSGVGPEEPVHLVRQPGDREQYTNGGYTLLQLLVEDVTGEPFAAYMQREVLAPLGMRHSTYQWAPELRASLATGYQVSGRPVDHRSYPEAAGGLYSTATDIATWLAASVPGPDGEPAGRNVLQPDTTVSMVTPVLATKSSGNGLGYVAETLPNGVRMILHSGDLPGWRGQYAALLDQRSGIVVLTNGNVGGRYVIADTICSWSRWAAGVVPRACRTYQALYGALPVFASIGGLAVIASIWRWVTQLRSGERKLDWPPKTGRQRRDMLLSLLAVALWWLMVVPRIGLLLPPAFSWVSLAYTLWCLAMAARGLTLVIDEPS